METVIAVIFVAAIGAGFYFYRKNRKSQGSGSSGGRGGSDRPNRH